MIHSILAWAIANKQGRINPDEIFNRKPMLHKSDKDAGYRAVRVRISAVSRKVNP